jgi:hypothetical protein
LFENFPHRPATAIVTELNTRSYQSFTSDTKESGTPLLFFSYKVLGSHVYQALVRKTLQSGYFVPGSSNIQIPLGNRSMPLFFYSVDHHSNAFLDLRNMVHMTKVNIDSYQFGYMNENSEDIFLHKK